MMVKTVNLKVVVAQKLSPIVKDCDTKTSSKDFFSPQRMGHRQASLCPSNRQSIKRPSLRVQSAFSPFANKSATTKPFRVKQSGYKKRKELRKAASNQKPTSSDRDNNSPIEDTAAQIESLRLASGRMSHAKTLSSLNPRELTQHHVKMALSTQVFNDLKRKRDKRLHVSASTEKKRQHSANENAFPIASQTTVLPRDSKPFTGKENVAFGLISPRRPFTSSKHSQGLVHGSLILQSEQKKNFVIRGETLVQTLKITEVNSEKTPTQTAKKVRPSTTAGVQNFSSLDKSHQRKSLMKEFNMIASQRADFVSLASQFNAGAETLLAMKQDKLRQMTCVQSMRIAPDELKIQSLRGKSGERVDAKSTVTLEKFPNVTQTTI